MLRKLAASLLLLGVLAWNVSAQNWPAVNSTLPCSSGQYSKWTGTEWGCDTPSAGGVSAGLITFVLTGTCPSGWTEVAALNGKAIYGTVAANGDVGGAVGSDTITPTVNSLTAAAQTVNSLTAAAQTFTGDSTTVPALGAGTLATAWPVGVPTISGSSAGEAAHTHTYTQVVNHTHGLSFARGATTGGATTQQGFTSSTDTSSTAITQVTDNPSGGVATGTSAAGTSHTHGAGTLATSWPAGVPTISGSTATGSLTPLGHNAASAVTGTMNSSAVTGTLNSFDNRPAGIKAIFCSKD